MNQVFVKMKEKMPPELRARIDGEEKEGLFGHGKDYQKNRYTDDYMIAAWGEGYFPYLYQNHPDPNYDPIAAGNTAWDLYREMWGSDGEFVIDGNLKSVEYVDQLPTIHVPDADHRRRSRRVRPIALEGNARKNRGLGDRDFAQERPHDLRRPAQNVQ